MCHSGPTRRFTHSRWPAAARRRTATIVLLLLVVAGSSGCMYRRLTIRSDPPGALVMIDGREVGFTPYSTDFIYYGTREITLIKDGYETLTVMQPVPPPWYQIPPLDFVSDNFLPFKVTNRHEFVYALEPQQIPPVEDLIDRANHLRSETQFGR